MLAFLPACRRAAVRGAGSLDLVLRLRTAVGGGSCVDDACSRTVFSGVRRSSLISAVPGWAMPKRCCCIVPGIEVKELKPTGDNQVEVKLAIAADCPLGFHGVRVRTATGISNLQTFSVGALPEVAEVEPNNDFAQSSVDRAGLHGQWRDHERGRRLLRGARPRKGQRIIGGAGRCSAGHAARQRHVLRSFRGDPGCEAI